MIARHFRRDRCGWPPNAKALDQPVLGSQHLVLGIELGETGSLGLLLHIVARVLRVQHIEERSPADVELLAIGQEQVVRNPALGFQLSG